MPTRSYLSAAYILDWYKRVCDSYPAGLDDYGDVHSVKIMMASCVEWVCIDDEVRADLNEEQLPIWEEKFADDRAAILALKDKLARWLIGRGLTP